VQRVVSNGMQPVNDKQPTHSRVCTGSFGYCCHCTLPLHAPCPRACFCFVFCFLFFVLFSAGGTNLKDLMQVPLTPARLSNAAVVVVVDLSQVRPPAKSPRWLAFAFCILLAYPP